MKTDKNSTELTAPGQYTISDVPKLLEQAKQKLATLQGNASGDIKEITVSLPGFGSVQGINSTSQLIKAIASVDGKEKSFKAAHKRHFTTIEPKCPQFLIEGHSPKAWRDNIKLAYTKIKNESETAKVKEAITLLEENLSKEAKFNNNMQKIVGLFADED